MIAFLIHPVAVSLSVYNERLAVVLGIMTLISALALFLSCRVCLRILPKIGCQNLIASRGFQRFLKYHTYYWWTFWLIFGIHLMSAIMHLGFGSTGDPDAYLHKYSVIFGVSALLVVLVASYSCRWVATLYRLFSERGPSDSKFFSMVYRYHAYYWLVFFLLIAAHFVVGYKHSGWWPTGI